MSSIEADWQLSSYGQMASHMVPRAFNLSIHYLEDLNMNSDPSGVKPLRISLLRTREAIDLFIFAYDPSSHHHLITDDNPHLFVGVGNIDVCYYSNPRALSRPASTELTLLQLEDDSYIEITP